jgi:hypothetical protein
MNSMGWGQCSNHEAFVEIDYILAVASPLGISQIVISICRKSHNVSMCSRMPSFGSQVPARSLSSCSFRFPSFSYINLDN